MPASFREIPGVTLFSHCTRNLIWFQFFVRYFLLLTRNVDLCRTSDDDASAPAARPPPAQAAHHTPRSHAAPTGQHARRTPPTTPHTEDGDSRQARPLHPIVVGRSTTGGNGDRSKRRQAAAQPPAPHTEIDGKSMIWESLLRQSPQTEIWGHLLYSRHPHRQTPRTETTRTQRSKTRTALERTLEPDVQNRRTVGRAHSLRNRQILAVAIPDALPGKQEGVGGKQVVDHV